MKNLNKLLSNPNFIKLDMATKEFNFFRSIGAEDYEIRHSKFLAFLLDPNQAHDLGVEFLLGFLLKLSLISRDEIFILELDLDYARAFTESKLNGGRIDIKLEIPYKDSGKDFLVVLIEIKWRSKQHSGQLQKYYQQTKNDGLNRNIQQKIIALFLTIDGEEPEGDEKENWCYASYQDIIVPVIKNTKQKKYQSISPKLMFALDDWLDLLAEVSSDVSDRQSVIDEHCENLLDYKDILKENVIKEFLSLKHGRALKKLENYIERLADNRGRLLSIFEDKMSGGALIALYSNKTYLRFYPKSDYPFVFVDSGFQIGDGNSSVPLAFEIEVREVGNSLKVRLVLVLSDTEALMGYEEREEIVKKIRSGFAEDKSWTYTSSKVTTYWTRVLRKNRFAQLNNDADFNSKAVEIINSYVEEAARIREKLEEILKDTKLCKRV